MSSIKEFATDLAERAMNSPTDIAAWWGAVVATLALGLEVLRWRLSRPRLIVKLEPQVDGLIRATIINTGQRDTDLVEAHFVRFETWWNKVRGRESGRIDVNHGTAVGNDRLPQRIRAHGSWQGRFFTEKWVTSRPASVHVVFHLYEAWRPTKPLLVPVPRLLSRDELVKAVLKLK